MGWTIIKDKKDADKTTIAFPEEKKEAVFFNGRLSSVTVDGVKVLYPDGVRPLSVTDKEGKAVSGDMAQKAISTANAFVARIDNNAVVFNQNYPNHFGTNMLAQAANRVETRVADVASEMQKRQERLKNAMAMKEAKKKIARASPELATIEGDVDDYNVTMRDEEKRIAAAYGVAPNASKPDGKWTEAQLQQYKESLDTMYENIRKAMAKANTMQVNPATRVGGGRN